MERRSFIKLSATAGASLCFQRVFALENTIFGDDVYVDNLIIGSGYGGAVAALRLTQAGHKATMLEMGLDWDKQNGAYKPYSNLITPKRNSTWLRTQTVAPMMNISHFNKKFTGILDRMDFENIKIYAGRGVGGGSLVNGGMAVQPKQAYFKEIFPDLDAPLFWKKYYPLAKKELEVNEISETFYQQSPYYKFARVGALEAEKAGFKVVRVPNVYSFKYMEQEQAGKVPKSALAKEVIYGNNYGKQSLDKTYLHKARQTGLLTILDLHRAASIEKLSIGGYRVKVEILNTAGIVVEEKNIICKKLFLNAGSIGSTKLLLRSAALGLLPGMQKIGQFWGNNGNIMTGRNMVNTVFNKVGKNENGLGRGTGVKQATIPVAGVDHWEDGKNAFFAEISPLPMGMEVYTALYLVINKVPQPGTIVYDSATQDVKINWTLKNYGHTIDNAKFFVKKMNEANGGTNAGLLFNKGYGADICYHPLGGVTLGQSTDNYGRVKACTHLYVTDAALVPASIGVNPFLTITALAEHCMEDILARDF